MADLVADPEFPRQLFPIPVLRRTYPAGSIASNVTGFVGEINENELRQMEGKSYVGETRSGKTGIERQYRRSFAGSPEENPSRWTPGGRRVRQIDTYPAGRGEDLHLTLDLGAAPGGRSSPGILAER